MINDDVRCFFVVRCMHVDDTVHTQKMKKRMRPHTTINTRARNTTSKTPTRTTVEKLPKNQKIPATNHTHATTVCLKKSYENEQKRNTNTHDSNRGIQ